MASDLKNRLRSLLERCPPVERLVGSAYRRWHFRTELALIRGTHRNGNRHPSIIHFSFNKAATQYVRSILERCAKAQGMVPVGLHDYAFNTDFPFLDGLSAEEMEAYRHIFKPLGYLYSVFGGMIDGIPALDQYKLVLVTRDPRDILVSHYYSTAFSHTVPLQGGDKHGYFLERRVQARRTTEDEFALSESDDLLGIFMRYEQLLLKKHPHVHVTSYEQMVSDFETWLASLLEYCELSADPALRTSLLMENEKLRPKKEDVRRHLRKGKAGDHREKLKPETIRILNDKFADVLQTFGYDREKGGGPSSCSKT